MSDNQCLRYREDEEEEEEQNDEECDETNEKQPRIGAQKATGKNKRAKAESNYAQSGTYTAAFENQPGQRIPKVGAYAEAGVGRARAECSVFEAEAKGPNASAGAEASAVRARAMARAEIASTMAKASPFQAKVGLGLDTGAPVGLSEVDVKLLGTGFSVGPKTGVSILGSEASCAIM